MSLIDLAHLKDGSGVSGLRGKLTALVGRLRAAGRSENGASQKMAAMAFAIRIGSAGVVFITQALLARWMGAYEFGTYVYVWTLLLVVADIVHLGLPLTAQRFIPEYREGGTPALLRGYLGGAAWIVFAAATVAALLAALAIHWSGEAIAPSLAGALYCGLVALPFYAMTLMTDGIARSFNWMGVALFPAYVVRPLLLVVSAAAFHLAGYDLDATAIMAMMAAGGWIAVIVQILQLHVRLKTVVPAGPKAYAPRVWVVTSLPVMMTWGLYTLMMSTDVLMLKNLATPVETAHYFAAAKTVALVGIIYFAVAAATAHRFTSLAAAKDRTGLSAFAASTVRWMFWPSLALGLAIGVSGPLVLLLFGADFIVAYPAMLVLIAGHLVRASIGPAERILSMLGQQRVAVGVYAAAVTFNIGTALMLVPVLGLTGAAIATAGAFMLESALLYGLVRRRLGLKMAIWHPHGT